MSYAYDKFKKLAYKVLHIVTLGNGVPVTINGVKMKLPTKYFRLFPKDYEKQGFDFFKKHLKKGDTIIDIGAHIGLYSVFFAKHTNGRVYSFEPTPGTVDVLRKNLRINKVEKNVSVFQGAVSDKPGKAVFYSNDLDVSTSNSLVNWEFNDGTIRKGAYEVNITSVDEFRKTNNLKVDMLKIDAEGVELDVLNGTRETFLQDRPKAIIGLHPFAYKNRVEMLGMVWEKLKEYKMQVQVDGMNITKEEFCNRKEPVFDVELLPA